MVIIMRHNPKPQEMYRHFKGNLYQIRCLATHSETGEQMVVYQAMYDTFKIYVRPLAMFMEEVDHVNYPDVKQKYRFELLQDMESGDETYEAEADAASDITFHKDETSPIVPEKAVEDVSEELHIDPLVMEFLEADTYEQRLNILAALQSRVTDDMINTMAAAVDLEIKDGNIDARYDELKNCLLTFDKYECSRLR
jgi:hypothetical protein